MALPFNPIEKPVTIGTRKASAPKEAANGIPASMCAPSSNPKHTLSRILAQDGSRDRVARKPKSLKKPFSRAITKGAQSVSGMKPNETSSFSNPPITIELAGGLKPCLLVCAFTEIASHGFARFAGNKKGI